MSSASSGTAAELGIRGRQRFVGVPSRCWCGEKIVQLMSKSTSNPYRRYYRCDYAVEKKLHNDSHTFKWVDEALVDEIDALYGRTKALEDKLEHLLCRRGASALTDMGDTNAAVGSPISGKGATMMRPGCFTPLTMYGLCFGCIVIVGCYKLLV